MRDGKLFNGNRDHSPNKLRNCRVSHFSKTNILLIININYALCSQMFNLQMIYKYIHFPIISILFIYYCYNINSSLKCLLCTIEGSLLIKYHNYAIILYILLQYKFQVPHTSVFSKPWIDNSFNICTYPYYRSTHRLVFQLQSSLYLTFVIIVTQKKVGKC